MALSSFNTFIVTTTMSIIVFSSMQIFKVQLASSEWFTIGGGALGSVLFFCLLTAVSNFEMILFGENFQAKLLPEVFGCLAAACFASGLIHRVCVTVCFILSMLDLYYINKISTKTFQAPVSVGVKTRSKGKQKKH